MKGVAWGGSEELWSQTALRLRAAGHKVQASVVKWPRRPAQLKALEKAGIPITFRARRPGPFARVARKLFRKSRTGDLANADRAWLKRGRFDLVVISQGGPWDGLPWMRACRELGVPYCDIVHANSEIWWPRDDQLDDAIEAAQDARRMFFVSKANRRLMETQLGLRLENAEVVANPRLVDHTHEVAWPGDNGHTALACVGRLEPDAKGQDVLLAVLAQEKWRQRPITVNFFGTGRSEKSVRRMANFFALPNARFHGHVPDVQAIWERNHALVLPSRFEGLPLVIVEAMLCGRPVIATDVAGSREIIAEGRNGFIAAAPTPELLDQAMERAWSRRAEWQSLGETARADAVAGFPADPVGCFARRLLELIA